MAIWNAQYCSSADSRRVGSFYNTQISVRSLNLKALSSGLNIRLRTSRTAEQGQLRLVSALIASHTHFPIVCTPPPHYLTTDLSQPLSPPKTPFSIPSIPLLSSAAFQSCSEFQIASNPSRIQMFPLIFFSPLNLFKKPKLFIQETRVIILSRMRKCIHFPLSLPNDVLFINVPWECHEKEQNRLLSSFPSFGEYPNDGLKLLSPQEITKVWSRNDL